jgi:uncharacterized protein YecE (DUF72 family)
MYVEPLDFFEICTALGRKLGPFLVGLPSSFKKDLERFNEFLSFFLTTALSFSFATTRGIATMFLTV